MPKPDNCRCDSTCDHCGSDVWVNEGTTCGNCGETNWKAELAAHALPEDAPGAWIRRAIREQAK